MYAKTAYQRQQIWYHMHAKTAFYMHAKYVLIIYTAKSIFVYQYHKFLFLFIHIFMGPGLKATRSYSQERSPTPTYCSFYVLNCD